MKHAGQKRSLPQRQKSLFQTGLVCGLLILLTFSAFNTAIENGFTQCDDPGYVTANYRVRQGITLDNIGWAFANVSMCNWHPLTWLSHMLDVELYGTNPAGHHLTSLVIHIAAVLLLFLWLSRTTGCFWSSALAAALFAIHPLRVESVAWISERKDVLSAFWGILTLWIYTVYAADGKRRWSIAAVFCLVMGLMAKAMLVTWPFVLILLDAWPLRRLRLGRWGSPANSHPRPVTLYESVKEKWPLFLVSLVFCVVTFWAQKETGAVMELERLPLAGRIENSVSAYFLYLWKTVYPTGLSVLYTMESGSHPVRTLLGIGLLAAVSIASVFQLPKRPWIPVGWFWFLGTLVPVIGLVQVGTQSMADRYSYLPSIGLMFILAWASGEAAAGGRVRKWLVTGFWSAALLVLLGMTWIQVCYWKDTVTLFQHAHRVNPDDKVIAINYATALCIIGAYEEADRITVSVLDRHPEYVPAMMTKGSIYYGQQHYDKAFEYYRKAAEADVKGRPEALRMMAAICLRRNEYQAAADYYAQAAGIAPDDVASLTGLGQAHNAMGQTSKAFAVWQQALAIDPYSVETLQLIAWTMATAEVPAFRRPAQALEYAQRLCRLTEDSAESLDILAAAYAADGQYDLAVKTAQRALAAAKQSGQPGLAGAIESRLAQYRGGKRQPK